MNRLGARLAAGLITASSIAAAVFIAACGFGPGEERGSAEVLITRDYGRVVMHEGSQPVRESDDAMRLLTRSAPRVETAYGGGFVESIGGYGSSSTGGSQTDWFFYLDGTESPVGALEAKVEPGQSVWWDRRDWSEAMHVPAVVGAWPRPFGSDSPEIGVECSMPARADCDGVLSDLRRTGARATYQRADSASLRVLVGPWDKLRSDPLASSIERGPSVSGVYARFESRGDSWTLQALDSSGDPVGAAARSGLIAALSDRPDRAVWVVTGSDESTVPRHLASADLMRRYAVVYPGGPGAAPLEVPRP